MTPLVAIWLVENPHLPTFVQYVSFRDFTQPVETSAAGDLGPEGLLFTKADDGPNGQPLLVVGNEISGTTTVYEIRKQDQ